jgi:hypothetical protein
MMNGINDELILAARLLLDGVPTPPRLRAERIQRLDRYLGSTKGLDMLKRARTAILSFLAAISLLVDGPLTASAEVRLPDATRAGFAEKLYRLDCGHSLANDKSFWTPGENFGRSIEFSFDLLADTAGKGMVALGYGRS